MIINHLNGEAFFATSFNIHDHIFNSMQFDYKEKNIYVEITATDSSNEKYTVEFAKVIGFEMILCDFWGKSPHILSCEFIKSSDYVLIKKLVEEEEINHYCCSSLSKNKTYIETVFVFTSGDRLTIACEYIRTGDKGQGDGSPVS